MDILGTNLEKDWRDWVGNSKNQRLGFKNSRDNKRGLEEEDEFVLSVLPFPFSSLFVMLAVILLVSRPTGLMWQPGP